MPSPPNKEAIAQLFPNLEIQWIAGEGGMGVVYKAIQQSLERTVALKILPPEFTADAVHRVRFGIEAKAMSRLSHPGLLELYDFGETEGVSWMLQEWVEGKTLHQMELEGGLAPEEACALVCQVCDVLGYVHSNGIIHRDIKPSNIMMDADGKVKLIDFGLARAAKGGSNSLISSIAGTKFATVEYAAPEVWVDNSSIDHRADIFSLGVLLYEALTGKRPTGVFRMPSEIKPDLDPRFDAIIVKSMQESPDNRYQSCEEFMQALQSVIQPSNESSSTSNNPTLSSSTAPVDTEQKSAKGKIAAILGLCALVVIAIVLLQTKTKSNEAAQKDDPEIQDSTPAISNTEEEAALSNSHNNLNGDPLIVVEKVTTPATPAPTVAPQKTSVNPLKKLNRQTRKKAAPILKSYQTSLTALRAEYIEDCQREDQKATASGDLDAIMLWQQELKHIKEAGEPSTEMADVPERLATLREDWNTNTTAVREPLLVLQQEYLTKCSELEKLETSKGNTKRANEIREHRQSLSAFPAFLDFLSPNSF